MARKRSRKRPIRTFCKSIHLSLPTWRLAQRVAQLKGETLETTVEFALQRILPGWETYLKGMKSCDKIGKRSAS